MTDKQRARVNGYYWVEHLGPRRFRVKDADGAGEDLEFETRREAERFIMSLQRQDEERRWEI